MKRRAQPVHTPEPELRARVVGTASPAALESFAEFLLERIRKNENNAPRRSVLQVVKRPG